MSCYPNGCPYWWRPNLLPMPSGFYFHPNYKNMCFPPARSNYSLSPPQNNNASSSHDFSRETTQEHTDLGESPRTGGNELLLEAEIFNPRGNYRERDYRHMAYQSPDSERIDNSGENHQHEFLDDGQSVLGDAPESHKPVYHGENAISYADYLSRIGAEHSFKPLRQAPNESEFKDQPHTRETCERCTEIVQNKSTQTPNCFENEISEFQRKEDLKGEKTSYESIREEKMIYPRISDFPPRYQEENSEGTTDLQPSYEMIEEEETGGQKSKNGLTGTEERGLNIPWEEAERSMGNEFNLPQNRVSCSQWQRFQDPPEEQSISRFNDLKSNASEEGSEKPPLVSYCRSKTHAEVISYPEDREADAYYPPQSYSQQKPQSTETPSSDCDLQHNTSPFNNSESYSCQNRGNLDEAPELLVHNDNLNEEAENSGETECAMKENNTCKYQSYEEYIRRGGNQRPVHSGPGRCFAQSPFRSQTRSFDLTGVEVDYTDCPYRTQRREIPPHSDRAAGACYSPQSYCQDRPHPAQNAFSGCNSDAYASSVNHTGTRFSHNEAEMCGDGEIYTQEECEIEVEDTNKYQSYEEYVQGLGNQKSEGSCAQDSARGEKHSMVPTGYEDATRNYSCQNPNDSDCGRLEGPNEQKARNKILDRIISEESNSTKDPSSGAKGETTGDVGGIPQCNSKDGQNAPEPQISAEPLGPDFFPHATELVEDLDLTDISGPAPTIHTASEVPMGGMQRSKIIERATELMSKIPETKDPQISTPILTEPLETANPKTGTGMPETETPVTLTPIDVTRVPGTSMTGTPVTGTPVTGTPVTGTAPVALSSLVTSLVSDQKKTEMSTTVAEEKTAEVQTPIGLPVPHTVSATDLDLDSLKGSPSSYEGVERTTIESLLEPMAAASQYQSVFQVPKGYYIQMVPVELLVSRKLQAPGLKILAKKYRTKTQRPKAKLRFNPGRILYKRKDGSKVVFKRQEYRGDEEEARRRDGIKRSKGEERETLKPVLKRTRSKKFLKMVLGRN